MKLSKLGSFVLLLTNEWQEYCKENGIEDPFKKRQEIIGKTFYSSTATMLGKEIPCTRQRTLTAEEAAMLPIDEECMQFRKMEQDYVAAHLLEYVTWEEFEEYIKMNKREDLLDNYFPCDALDGQCNLFCKNYGKCEVKEGK